MIVDDRFIRLNLGEVQKPLEWGIRIGLTGLIVLIGLLLSRRPEPVRES
jgi:hypothetical protein